MLARTGRCVAGLGVACIAVSAFVPFAYTQRGSVIQQFDHGLINYRQGWILLGLAALGLVGIIASYGVPWHGLVASLLLVTTGIAASAYAASIRGFDFLNLCLDGSCHIRTGPGSLFGVEPQASVAFPVAGLGGRLVAAGGIALAIGLVRRGVPRRGPVERTHPVWM